MGYCKQTGAILNVMSGTIYVVRAFGCQYYASSRPADVRCSFVRAGSSLYVLLN